MFTHLQLHSHYSLLEWIWTPKNYIAKAKELGMKSLALTDYNGLYGAIEFYKAAQDEKIHPLIWVELHCVHDITMKWHTSKWWWTIVLIAENNAWYQSLLKLVSHANMEWFDRTPRIDFWLLQKYWADLVCLVWWTRSILGKLILSQESTWKQQEIIWLLQKACWNNGVYLMIHAHDESKDNDLKTVNQCIVELSWKSITNNIPIVISGDVHYINPSDQKPFEVALSIRDGKRVYDEDRRIVTTQLHLTSENEVVKIMLENWYKQEFIDYSFEIIESIVQRCQCKINLNQLLFPKYKAPEEIKKLYEQHKHWLISE